jgi:hypothetical protein
MEEKHNNIRGPSSNGLEPEAKVPGHNDSV